MMTFFGIVQFFFWANLAYLCYTDVGKGSRVAVPEEKQGSFWAEVIEIQSRYKYRLAVACMALGIHVV